MRSEHRSQQSQYRSTKRQTIGERLRSIFSAFCENLFLLLVLMFIGYAVEIVDLLIRKTHDLNLDLWAGIRPRDLGSIHSIFTAHFFHGDWEHVFGNTIPFLLFGACVLIRGQGVFWMVSIFVAIFGGGLLWLLGINGIHIGASLVIFGYLGFLLSRGIFERSAFWIIISIVTLPVYSFMFTSLLPFQKGISWDGHLYGFIAGIVSAFLVPTATKRKG